MVKRTESSFMSTGVLRQKEHRQELNKVLDSNSAWLRKTYKPQAEANDNVWFFNEDTEKATCWQGCGGRRPEDGGEGGVYRQIGRGQAGVSGSRRCDEIAEEGM